MHTRRRHHNGASRRLTRTALAAACLLGALLGPLAAGAGAAARVPAAQRLAVLLSDHRAYSEPRGGSPLMMSVPARRPLTGETTALPVLGTLRAGGVTWLRVMLPGRPNSSSGWIDQQGTHSASTEWRLRLDLAHRRLTVFLEGQTAKVFSTVIGKSATPTPTGSFFVEETLRMRAGEPGGPFALALSARSDALQEFEGGPGQIAIHGRANLGGTLGQAESHGCVRLGTPAIDWLAGRIGPGVPVTIVHG
jgi:L,D-transpeptidase catalytic domain